MIKYLLDLYQNTFSLFLSIFFGRGCRFTPSCSEYAKEAIETHGILKGTLFSFKRLSKCHPWGPHGYDPIPPSN